MPVHWLLDFDETLATSSISWALDAAFPRLIQEHALPFDAARFRSAVLTAQSLSAVNHAPETVLAGLFDTLGWPATLVGPFLQDALHNYQPALFGDALPFLKRLRAAGHRAFILSNNRRAARLVVQFQIERYVDGVFVPDAERGLRPKPDRSLWDALCRADESVNATNAVLVGDDPWVDGVLAERCGLPCWIVDRGGRFADRPEVVAYRVVASLDAIEVS